MVKSAAGISMVPIESRLLCERKVFIQGEINDETACVFEQQIHYLMTENSEKPIDIFITTPGGVVSAGLHIYDIVKSLKVAINMCCRGTTASMGAIILAGGQKGHCFILPHAKVLIHEPLIAGGFGGSATSIQRTAESILETKRITVDLLTADTGQPRDVVERAISFDNYMNAQEAVNFGIVDKVVSSIF